MAKESIKKCVCARVLHVYIYIGRPNPIVSPRTKDSSQFASILVKGSTFEEVPTIAKPQYHLSTNFLLIKLMSSTFNSFISFGQNVVPPKQVELIYDDSLFLKLKSKISSDLQPLSLRFIIIRCFWASSCVLSLLVMLVTNFASIVC
ncbi:hypothetical protein AMTRI_Chr12g240610 [Amborella trichopoda]